MGEEGISPLSCFAQISCFEGNTDPTFCVVRLVDSIMNPPGAVIVPEVMIRILRIDFDAEGGPGGLKGCCAHVDASPFVDASRCGHKKPPTHSCAGGWPAENHCSSQDLPVSHIGKGPWVFFQPPWVSPAPVGGPPSCNGSTRNAGCNLINPQGRSSP